MTSRLAHALRGNLERGRKRYTAGHLRIISFDFRAKIGGLHRQLEKRDRELSIRCERILRAQRDRLDRLRLQLEERSPLRVLERGYAIVTDLAGNIVRDAAQVAVGDALGLQLHRGRLTTEVKRKAEV
jgi:exodeoxyribonuclease VII large subunit